MRILQWGPLPTKGQTGGVEKYIYNLSNKLSEMGHEVDVCTFGFGKVTNSKIVKFPIKKYDVVHVHLCLKSFGILSFLKKIISQEKLIFTIHIVHNPKVEKEEMFSDKVKSWAEFYFSKFLSKHADIVTAVSEYSRRRCIEDYGVDPIVIPNGVDISKFYPMKKNDAKEIIKEKYGLNTKEEKVITYLGRLSHTKGVFVLIEAFSKVLLSFPDARLVIGGTGYYKNELEKLSKKLNIANKVSFLGFIPDEILLPLYNTTDIFCIPTLGKEGMPTTALEAMATRTVVLATRVGGLKEIIKNGKNGILVEPGNTEALADALCNLLESEAKRRYLSFNALEYVRRNNDWKIITNKYLSIYNG